MKINESQKALEITKRETDIILQNLHEGVFLIDSQYRISEQYSAGLLKILNEKNLKKRNFIEVIASKISQVDLDNLKEYLDLMFNKNVDEIFLEYLNPLSDIKTEFTDIKSKSQITKYLTFTFRRIKSDQGDINSLIATVRDITKQTLMEKQIKESETLKVVTKELQRSNAELEQFAYVVSHDLQEPLRKIQAFGDRLKLSCSNKLDVKSIDYLNRMINASERMQNLINGLLSYSRVTTRAKPFEPVSLSEIIQSVISDLEFQINRSKGIVKIEKMPDISADPLQMRQLFQNLISNALKFQQIDKAPVIKIHGKVVERKHDRYTKITSLSNNCQIVIEDNGIGFEEKYEEQIFGVFQRLHTRAEYEGAGIGLAICKKIVERHGGSITAKSTLNQGSQFIITLPIEH